MKSYIVCITSLDQKSKMLIITGTRAMTSLIVATLTNVFTVKACAAAYLVLFNSA